MPTNSYDLIVLGDELAGLIAATLCARRGLRVLIVSDGDHQSRYEFEQYKLPTRPLPFIGMSSPAIRRVLDELHFVHPIKRRLAGVGPSFQFVTRDVRVDVPVDEFALRRELDREFPQTTMATSHCERASLVSRLLDAPFGQDICVPPTGFWDRREIARTAGRLESESKAWFERIDSESMSAMLRAPAAVSSSYAPGELSPEAFLRSFDLWRMGTPRLKGDFASLRNLFLDKFANHNGEVRAGRISNLLSGWGKVTGVCLDDGETLGAGHVIAAMPIGTLASLVEPKMSKRLSQTAAGLEIAGYRYALNIVLDEAGVPEGMARTVLVVPDPSAPLVGSNAFAVYVGEPDDQARVLVTIEATCALPSNEDLDSALAVLRGELRERLEMVMPFYTEHVLIAHSPHESAPGESFIGPVEIDRPASARPVWRSSLERSLGVSALPYSIGMKHLSLASSQVLPQLGLEADFEAGWCAAKLACTSTGKRKDYLKDKVIAGSA